MRIALIATGGRDLLKRWETAGPQLGSAVYALLQGFRQLPEHEIDVLMPMRRNAQPSWRDGNVTFHDVPTPMWGMMKSLYLGAASRIKQKLLEIRPDIVHGQGTERECGICAILSGFPNVITIHGNMAEQAKLFRPRIGSYAWLAAQLENFTLPRTFGVFCNSAHTESLVRPRARKTWRVPNALRSEFFGSKTSDAASNPGRPPVFLCIGNVVPLKRQLKLLDMAEDLWREGHHFALHFIGRANPAERYVATFLQRLSDDSDTRVRYLGELSTNEIIKQLDAASALVHFPSEEAFGLVVAEALARNLKFFGARLGGIQDIVEGIPGAELFAGDDFAGLATALKRWISEGCLHPDGAARIMETKYHPSVVARQHVQIYEEILREGQSKSFE